MSGPTTDAALREMVKVAQDEDPLEMFRSLVGELGEAWNSLYDTRGTLADEVHEDEFRITAAVRNLGKALDGITEAQEQIASEIAARQKRLGRL